MARKPDGWQDRNEHARRLGYRNYYDYRIHDYGRTPPGEEPRGGRERLRGHRSFSDLEGTLSGGRVELLMVNIAERNDLGQITRLEVMVTLEDGTMKGYQLREAQLTPEHLAALQDAVAVGGPDRISTYALEIFGADDYTYESYEEMREDDYGE